MKRLLALSSVLCAAILIVHARECALTVGYGSGWIERSCLDCIDGGDITDMLADRDQQVLKEMASADVFTDINYEADDGDMVPRAITTQSSLAVHLDAPSQTQTPVEMVPPPAPPLVDIDPDSSGLPLAPPLESEPQTNPPTTAPPKATKKRTSSFTISTTENLGPTTTTTSVFLRKIVKIHMNPTAATSRYPVKPGEPTFAAFPQGLLYIAGTPHRIMAADHAFYTVSAESDGSWETVDDVDWDEVNEQEEEHQAEIIAKGGTALDGVAAKSQAPSAQQLFDEWGWVMFLIMFTVCAVSVISYLLIQCLSL
ncbi:hypothetical protein Dda_4749 [Drechslerella dactyloides]|uniref:Uncharacterized protein n=1 Tax=Drechslerella dactyloides TaxID=74499 RepID=A0AAD6IXH3_DREDA|nr:hypothetical protein Dda_4749 [Drechslerella dactyloides]